ncbi:MAG: Anthranilate synthase component 1 [Thermoanaerobaculia bacterium]|nr:Anthranilate synthase component 1 [Thermoanaerobaculia bacterium]
MKIVTRERPADLTTPVAVMRNLLATGEPCFLLESVERGERPARWSFLGVSPKRSFSSRDGNPFELLKAVPDSPPAAGEEDLPPFTGGAVGYVGYDCVRLLERLPGKNSGDTGQPEAWFGVFTEIIAFDHLRHRLLFITRVPEGREEEARTELERLEKAALRTPDAASAKRESHALAWDESLSRGAYMEAVEQAKEYIRAGDIFQVVLSRRFSAPYPGDSFAVYRALRSISPSPYQYFLRTPAGDIFGASPERLVRVQQQAGGAVAETIPLAGTRPRGKTRAEDHKLEEELLADEKERAEHIMLVDLGRNDLGRVGRRGTVTVDEFMQVVHASHVMHIASRVTCRLAPGKDAVDALAATFPAGTLSGAPKVRAMEIIEELEPVRRGPYGGALGYLDFSGNLDMAIAIRTALVTNGRLYIQSGAGIVADSVPEREAEECENKAAALMRAVERAGEYES